jgi:hypothetical protein
MQYFCQKYRISAAFRRLGLSNARFVVGYSLFAIASIGSLSGAQPTDQMGVQPAVDKGVVLPPSRPSPTIRQDQTALAIVRSYQKAVGKTVWSDLEATGTIVPEALRADGVPSEQDASLSVLGHSGYRLDIQTPKGAISIRIDGVYGAMRPPGEQVIPIDAPDAATGLVAFPQLQDPKFPAKTISLIDDGTIPVDGVPLYRITVEAPWVGFSARGHLESGISITDLYFDPATHMLVKSANVLQGTNPRLPHYVKVLTYRDYRTVSGIQIPFLLGESLNGHRTWMLQLNHVQLSTGLDAKLFSFQQF